MVGVVPKIPAPPLVLAVAIVASIFASPCTAGRPLPAVDAAPANPPVENLPPSPAAQDFIRTRCYQCTPVHPEKSKISYELLLPYAMYINGSYNRAAIAGVTVMVSKFKASATSNPLPKGGCIQVVNGAISGAKEALTKLGRLDAIGDDKVDAENPDLLDVYHWILNVMDKFIDKCLDASAGHVSAVLAAADSSLTTALILIRSHRPYWKDFPLQTDQVHMARLALQTLRYDPPAGRPLSMQIDSGLFSSIKFLY